MLLQEQSTIEGAESKDGMENLIISEGWHGEPVCQWCKKKGRAGDSILKEFKHVDERVNS